MNLELDKTIRIGDQLRILPKDVRRTIIGNRMIMYERPQYSTDSKIQIIIIEKGRISILSIFSNSPVHSHELSQFHAIIL